MHAFLLIALLLFSSSSLSAHAVQRDAGNLDRLPVLFEEGEPAAAARFLARTSGAEVRFLPDRVQFFASGSRSPTELRFVGRDPRAVLTAELRASSYSLYYLGAGKTPRRAAHFAQIRYRGIYPGIDVVFHANGQRLEYDFVLAPNADPQQIEIGFSGASELRLEKGDVVLPAGQGLWRQQPPVVYQESAAGETPPRRLISGEYVKTGNNRLAFRLAPYDRSRSLVIDPLLSYSTYVGGSASDTANAITADSAGNVYLGGTTLSYDLLSDVGAATRPADSSSLPNNAFVAKLTNHGRKLAYFTYFGGRGSDAITALTIDGAGDVYATGTTTSDNLPVTSGAYRASTVTNPSDSFALKLTPTGAVAYATYLAGAAGATTATGIAVDQSGKAYITGTVSAQTAYPTSAHAFQTANRGHRDVFVTALNPAGTAAVYSTLLGSTGDDTPAAIVVNSAGEATVAGTADPLGNQPTDFPTTPGAYQTDPKVYAKGFVSRLSADGGSLLYSTLLGATFMDGITAMTADANGNVFVAGNAVSFDFPVTVGAYSPRDGFSFAAEFNSTLSQLLYSTRVIASGIAGMVVDSSGNAILAGTTGVNITTTTDAFRHVPSTDVSGVTGGAYLLEINATGSALTYATFFGGTGGEAANGVALDGTGGVYLTGWTASPNLPVTGDALQSHFNLLTTPAGTGVRDAFLADISLAPSSCNGLSVQPASFSLLVTGGPNSFTVTAPPGCPWAVNAESFGSNDPSWVTITSGASGIGTGTVSFTAAPNTTGLERTNLIIVNGGTAVLRVTAADVACTPSIQPAAISIPAIGGKSSVPVTVPGACQWTVSTDAPWLRLGDLGPGGVTTPQVYYASVPLPYFALPNTTGAVRTATLTINGQTFSVQQAAQIGPAVLSLSASPATLGNYLAFSVAYNDFTSETRTLQIAAPSSGSVPYTATVVGDPVFLTLSSTSGSTPATLTLTAINGGLPTLASVNSTFTNYVVVTTPNAAPAVYTVVLNVEPGSPPSPTLRPAKAGIFRPGTGLFLGDRNGDGLCCAGDLVGPMAQPGDIPLQGNWAGWPTYADNNRNRIGLYRPSTGTFLLDANDNGVYEPTLDLKFTLAPQAGDIPVVGDWLGTGHDAVGIFRNGTWYLDINGDGTFAGRAYLGQTGDIPLTGHWAGPLSNRSKVGIYRPQALNGQPGNFFLFDTNGDGAYTSADGPLFFLGQSGDVPMTGDWDGSGTTKVGVFRPASGLLILDQNGNNAWDGPGVDAVQFFGPYLNGLTSSTTIQPGDLPITGNWVPSYGAQNTANVQGRDRTGIYRPGTGTFFLDVSDDGTFQGRAYLGQSGDLPVGLPILQNGSVIGVNRLGNY